MKRMVLLPMLKDNLTFIRSFLGNINGDQIAFLVIMAIFLLDALILWAAFNRFERSRLLARDQ